MRDVVGASAGRAGKEQFSAVAALVERSYKGGLAVQAVLLAGVPTR